MGQDATCFDIWCAREGFSLFQSPQGDYILTPAYDLLNTSIHFPNEPSATGLDFFADGHFTAQYEELGFYSLPDFVELGKLFGVSADEVRKWTSAFSQRKKVGWGLSPVGRLC